MKMNRFILFLLTAGVLAACSGSQAGKGEASFEEDIDDGADPQRTENTVTSGQGDMAVTKHDAAAVRVPENDSMLRPGMRSGATVIIDFNADWCGPCRSFAPVFENVASQLGSEETVFYSVNVDNYPETAAAFGVQYIPHVVKITPDGKGSIYQIEDLSSAAALTEFVTNGK